TLGCSLEEEARASLTTEAQRTQGMIKTSTTTRQRWGPLPLRKLRLNLLRSSCSIGCSATRFFVAHLACPLNASLTKTSERKGRTGSTPRSPNPTPGSEGQGRPLPKTAARGPPWRSRTRPSRVRDRRPRWLQIFSLQG